MSSISPPPFKLQSTIGIVNANANTVRLNMRLWGPYEWQPGAVYDTAHGLPNKNILMLMPFLICTAVGGANGYAQSDNVFIGINDTAGGLRGFVFIWDGANIKVVFGANLSLLVKTTGAVVNLTAGSWDLWFRAIAESS